MQYCSQYCSLLTFYIHGAGKVHLRGAKPEGRARVLPLPLPRVRLLRGARSHHRGADRAHGARGDRVRQPLRPRCGVVQGQERRQRPVSLVRGNESRFEGKRDEDCGVFRKKRSFVER